MKLNLEVKAEMNLYEMDELLDVIVGDKTVREMMGCTMNISKQDVVRAIASAVLDRARLVTKED